MIISIEEKIRENHWRKTFDLADSCKEMADQGMPYELISKAIKKPTSLVVSLVRMSKFFPEGERLLNVPIRVYLEAALYPDPVATVERAWENNLQPEDLRKELESWAWRFDIMGYGDPPCLLPSYKRQRQTPLEEALGIDEEGNTTARKLYEFLELRSGDYSRWVRKNIEENVFAEPGIDYFSLRTDAECRNIGPRGNFARDYKLSGRFAKKLAMASNSPKGEQVRDYYIAVEERAKALTNGQMPAGKIPAEILLGVAEKYGDKLSKHTLDRIVQIATK
jgi:phage anti-repressor protein